MNLPRYWSRGTVEVADDQGKRHEFSCWGWSDESPADAEEKGRARALRLAARVLAGNRPNRYAYGDRPLREEVLEEVRNEQGARYAAVTRNAYGCQILNTAHVMFVDVDLPRPTFFEKLKHRLHTLLDRSAPTPAQLYEEAALAKLQLLVRADPRLGARAYRTRAGLRYLFTHDLADPQSEAVRDTLQALGADPLYVKLCRTQESFRARLTPKPWRCGLPAPAERWPWQSAAAEMRFRQWQARYARAAGEYATCRFIGQYGNGHPHPAIASLVALHDRRTRASAEMALA